MNAASVFCKTLESTCVFPFLYKDVEYSACTDVDTTVVTSDGDATSFQWCATRTDDAGYMIDGFWGKCASPEMCLDKEEEEPAAPEGMGERKGIKKCCQK